MHCAEEAFHQFFIEVNQEDYSLNKFLSLNEHILRKINVFNTWKQLKGHWTRMYKENLKKHKPSLVHLEKRLTAVENEHWIRIFNTLPFNPDALITELHKWLDEKLNKEAVTVDLDAIRRQVAIIENKANKTLDEHLKVMAVKYLNAFDSITFIQRCVLKLCLSGIINLNSEKFAAQYSLHLPTATYDNLLSLSPPSFITDAESNEIRSIFQQCRNDLFVEDKPIVANVKKGLAGQIGYICVVLLNKFAELESEEDSDDEEEDNSTRGVKRKLCSENDLLLIVKEILSAVFAETGLKWKSGEKTTQATKKSKLYTSKCTGTNCSNVMGRKSDLVLFNKNKLAICVSELKDDSSSSLSAAQESKSSRCTKAVKAYNSMFRGSESAWSLDWNGKRGYIYYMTKYDGVDVVLPGKRLLMPTEPSELDGFVETLIALFELKNALVEYNNQLATELQEEEEEGYHVYNSP